MRTLATSSTIEGLTRLVNEFFYSKGYKLETLANKNIILNEQDEPLKDFTWIIKNKRYYFKTLKKD